MLYRVKYVDNSEELVEADSISEARKEARCLFECPVKKIVVQDPHDCDDEADEDEDDDTDESDDSDESETEDEDEDESEEDA
ncbi:MAG: hypothetical protein WCT04_06285 [Planctomycetota bacterium]